MFKPSTRQSTLDLTSERSTLKNTLFIISIYLVIGIAWIFFSDLFLGVFIEDPKRIEDLQTVKGIFYVLTTGYLFYIIIKRRMDLYANTIIDLRSVVEKLRSTNETLSILESQLYDLAYYDELTGLLSRNMIAHKVLEHIESTPNDIFGFIYIDIDDFKHVNETKGHDVGDILIKMIADELRAIAGPPHFIGRLGGDEFVVILKNNLHKEPMLTLIKKYASRIQKSFMLEEEEYFISVSAGVATYPSDGKDYRTLLKSADMALSIAKQRGKNQIVLYSETFGEKLQKRTELSNMLNHSIDKNELVVYYQPIYEIKTDKVTSVEALIRWQHPTKGLIPPLDFILIAESTGFIKNITWFVIKESFNQRRIWLEQGFDVTMSINLSARMLSDNGFVDRIKKAIKDHNVDTSKCIFEITESSILEHIDESIITLNELKALGFKLALDDFGTGYSSLTYLQRLPIDILKIDRSFTKQIKTKTDYSALMKYTIELGHYLDLKVVVEGVEHDFQVDVLKGLNSDYLQGYYYARPNLPEELDHQKFCQNK